MYETEINNLGLNLSLRLYRVFEFLRFLGGETQRPIQINKSVISAMRNSVTFSHLDSKHDGRVKISLTSEVLPNSKCKVFSFCNKVFYEYEIFNYA